MIYCSSDTVSKLQRSVIIIIVIISYYPPTTEEWALRWYISAAIHSHAQRISHLATFRAKRFREKHSASLCSVQCNLKTRGNAIDVIGWSGNYNLSIVSILYYGAHISGISR